MNQIQFQDLFQIQNFLLHGEDQVFLFAVLLNWTISCTQSQSGIAEINMMEWV